MGLSRASGLLQRNHHPTYHYRDKSDEIQIGQQCVTYRESKGGLTLRFLCARREQRRMVCKEEFSPTFHPHASRRLTQLLGPAILAEKTESVVSTIDPSARMKKPTLAKAYITTTTKWDEDMTAKYIPASLLTVSRMLGTPGCVNLMSRVCTMTSTKTAISKGMWFNSKTGELRKMMKYLPKAKERDI